MAKSSAIEVKKSAATELTVFDGLEEDAGSGLENISASEYRIPFVRILDAKSPQCKPLANGGVAGAKPGGIFNNGTLEVYDGVAGFDFLPCARDHNYVEWLNRDAGRSGFVKAWDPLDPYIRKLEKEQGEFGKLLVDPSKPKESNQISKGFYLYGIMVPPTGFLARVGIPFSGMQLKKYQAIVTRLDGIRYPKRDGSGVFKPSLWTHKLHFTTVYEERADQSWYGWVIKFAARNEDGTEKSARESIVPSDSELYVSAKEFHDLIAKGAAKADFADADTSAVEAPRQRDSGDDEAPF